MIDKFKTLVLAVTTAAMMSPMSVGVAHAGGKDVAKVVAGLVILSAVANNMKNNRSNDDYHQSTRGNIYGNEIYRRGADAPRNFPIPHNQRDMNINRVPAAGAFNGFNGQTRYAIQRQLAYYGYYNADIDGAWGPSTWYAVQAYSNAAGIDRGLSSREGSYRIFQHLMN